MAEGTMKTIFWSRTEKATKKNKVKKSYKTICMTALLCVQSGVKCELAPVHLRLSLAWCILRVRSDIQIHKKKRKALMTLAVYSKETV